MRWRRSSARSTARTYGSCETPYQLTGVAAGAYKLSVRAINSVGGAGTPATYAWTVLAPPDTTLLTFPADPTEETTATFTFSSDQSGVTFQCALDEAVDDQVFVPCSSPQTYTDLIFGEHEFAVRAIDAQGNFDPTPAEYQWLVGGPAPPVTIDAAPAARTDSRSATFEFSADGRNLRFECALDSGAFTLCDSPKTYNNLTLAPHTFQVRVYAPEAAGRAPITTFSWSVVEFDPPETTILFGPPSPSDSTTASFAFQSDEAAATFQCSLDGAPYSACPVPSDITGLTNGSHTLLVRAIDAYENVDADAGELHVGRRRRPDAAGHDVHLRARHPDDDRRRRGLQLRLRAGRDVRVLVRRRAVRRAARRRWSSASCRSATTRSASARRTWRATSSRR